MWIRDTSLPIMMPADRFSSPETHRPPVSSGGRLISLYEHDPHAMAETALDDVDFLARSGHRVTVLRTLADGAMTRPDLHEVTGISQPTLGRVLGSFEERNWVERRGRAYALTAFGELVHEEFTELLDTVATVQNLGDVLRQLPTEEMPFDLRAFADATVHRPEPGDTLSHVRWMETTWLEADRTRLLGGTLGPASFNERREHARKVVDGERMTEHIETIVSAAMLEQGLSDPELMGMVLEAWDPDWIRAYLYDGPIPTILAIADGVAMLAPTDEHGIPTAVVETEDATVREWVERRLDEYRAESTELTPETLTR
jgi:DNA-binding HxlR family transcriptional regulator